MLRADAAGETREGDTVVMAWEYQLVSFLVPVATMKKLNAAPVPEKKK